ncbi:MAG TPA: FGGY family carbohydrate kinase [Bacteroidales bacterium]|nr:FGGY family carbohydrate kinase [Bacteroidales bacterium]
MLLLGFDIGSSSVKVSLIDGETGQNKASAFYPKQEMPIIAVKQGWAEQNPEDWWTHLKAALQEVLSISAVQVSDIKAIGISYQMHGLVIVDKNHTVLRPSIIWCDSRATGIGAQAFNEIGREQCLSTLLNTPGNFTASKLKWIQQNEPEVYAKIHKIMLPGDYIAMKLTGEITTTISGLSEGMFWNFATATPSETLLQYYGFDSSLLARIVPTFGIQGYLNKQAAEELGLHTNITVSYRAGDQPNNALSLNVLEPGEIATTAGTSGIVYGVSEQITYDPLSRVNTFAHVNYTPNHIRLGVLLCINGTGILNSWIRKLVGNIPYETMNNMASKIAIGSDGVSIIPFGNGAERVLQDTNVQAHIHNISFTTHSQAHIIRAAQEGIAFSFQYGMEIMKQIGIHPTTIKAGKANMFLSPIFRETIAGISGATIELYNTDGSIGAARGAGIGCGLYSSTNEAFKGLTKLEEINPDVQNKTAYIDAYERWKKHVEQILNT